MSDFRSSENKHSLIAMLYQMAMKDGVKSDVEMSFIKHACALFKVDPLNLSESVLKDKLPNYSGSLMQSIADLQKVILLMFVDGEVTEQEHEFCLELALKLGVSPQAVQLIIEKMLKSHGKPIDPKELFEIHNIHQN